MDKNKVKQNKVRLFVLVEEYQSTWLKKEAKKRKLSIGQLVRHWIDYAIKSDK